MNLENYPTAVTSEYYIVKINHPKGWQTQPEKFAFIEDAENGYQHNQYTKIFKVKETIVETEVE